jgi:hypothetical protein
MLAGRDCVSRRARNPDTNTYGAAYSTGLGELYIVGTMEADAWGGLEPTQFLCRRYGIAITIDLVAFT